MNWGPTTAASTGQMCSCSQVISGRSSATPRSRFIGLWVCAFTSPGISAEPGRETVSAGVKRARASAVGRTATMAPSRTATAWSSSTTPCGSTGTTRPASISRSTGSGVWVIGSCRLGRGSLHPADVLAGAGVHLDDLVLAHEQRHAHHGAGFQGGRLAAAAGGVTAHARIGLGDLQLDEVGRSHLDRRAVPQRHHALLLALEPLFGATHARGIGLHLLEALRVHEAPDLAVAV